MTRINVHLSGWRSYDQDTYTYDQDTYTYDQDTDTNDQDKDPYDQDTGLSLSVCIEGQTSVAWSLVPCCRVSCQGWSTQPPWP